MIDAQLDVGTVDLIDLRQTPTVLDALYRYAGSGGYCALRVFLHERGQSAQWAVDVKVGDLSSLIEAIERGIYYAATSTLPTVFCLATGCTFRRPGTAKTRDIAEGLALAVELDDGDTAAVLARLEALIGVPTLVVLSGGFWAEPETGELYPKRHAYWRLSEAARDEADLTLLYAARRNAAVLTGADPTGAALAHCYRWPGSLNRKNPARPARCTVERVNPDAEIHLIDAAEQLAEAIEGAGPSGNGGHNSDGAYQGRRELQADPALVAAAMAYIPNADVHYNEWVRMAYAVAGATGGTGYDILLDWSAKSSKHNAGETEALWSRVLAAGATQIGAGSIFHEAKQQGWIDPRRKKPDAPDEHCSGAQPNSDEQPSDAWTTEARVDGEDMSDPLRGLVEKAETDPGAPFAPEVLEGLAALKKVDRATFETLRMQLKKAGCRVTELDRAIVGDADGAALDPTQADILIELAQSAELYHTPDSTGFADLDVNGHRETWPIRSKAFRRWLTHGYFQKTEGAPNSEALQAALNVIEAKAHFDAPERVVHIRVGELGGRLYLDLVNETWQAVEIDETGWRVVDCPPVRFRRSAGMRSLPLPACGGSIETLRSFLNVKTDADFVLVVAWLLAALRNRGPYPVLVLSGEQGSAKSTFAGILRTLVDPNTAPLRALSREDRDLFIAASNGHVLAFDNVSGLPAWISDTLCRLATGGGFAVRQLYSDMDEVLFDACRPVILNGIEDVVSRPDLADRGLFQTLDPIPEDRRRPEAELWSAFNAERPRILGALLDAVAVGLGRLPETRLERLPRMADFALWVTACKSAFWPPGTFWSAYCGNRDEAVEGVIDADPVAASVRTMMVTRTMWTGTASDLLGALAEVAGERVAKSKTWPDGSRALSGRLRRAATFLRKIGIEVRFERDGHARTRTITITATLDPAAPENAGMRASASSAPSAVGRNSSPTNGFDDPQPRTVAVGADDMADASDREGAPTVRTKPLNAMGKTAADGADANRLSQSTPEKTVWRARL